LYRHQREFFIIEYKFENNYQTIYITIVSITIGKLFFLQAWAKKIVPKFGKYRRLMSLVLSNTHWIQDPTSWTSFWSKVAIVTVRSTIRNVSSWPQTTNSSNDRLVGNKFNWAYIGQIDIQFHDFGCWTELVYFAHLCPSSLYAVSF